MYFFYVQSKPLVVNEKQRNTHIFKHKNKLVCQSKCAILEGIRARTIKTTITNFTAKCAKYWQLEQLELGSTVRADRESL